VASPPVHKGRRLFCLLLLIVIPVLSAIFVWASDIMCPIVVAAKPFPGVKVCFVAVKGPFSAAWGHMKQIAADVKAVGVDPDSLPSFGIYYDNPSDVPHDQLRAVFGKIVAAALPGLRCADTGAFAAVQIDIPYRPLFLIGEKRYAYPAMNSYYAANGLNKSAFAELYKWHPGNVTVLGAAETVSGIMAEWPGPS
jgi:hypothetical protein